VGWITAVTLVPGIKLSGNGINVEIVSMNNTGVAGIFSLIAPFTQIESMLSSISNDYWLYASIPITVCVIMVHFICRHFFSIAWLSVKIFISLLVYVQIRDVVASFVGQDPLSIESSVFGIPSGTLELTRSLAMGLVKSRIYSTVLASCPACLPKPVPPVQEPYPVQEDESPPLQEDDKTTELSWVDWGRLLVM
jgi:hypothetical protein